MKNPRQMTDAELDEFIGQLQGQISSLNYALGQHNTYTDVVRLSDALQTAESTLTSALLVREAREITMR